MRGGWLGPLGGILTAMASVAWSADSEVLRQRVPIDQIESARAVSNPLPATAEVLEKGKALFEGKAFCRACLGVDGALTNPLPLTPDVLEEGRLYSRESLLSRV